MHEPLFASMREQMAPSREAREALSKRVNEEKPKRRNKQMWKYTVAAACAALALLTASPMRPGAVEPRLHSYVTLADGGPEQGQSAELTIDRGQGGPDTAEPNLGVADDPVQEGAVNAYQALMEHMGDELPAWYGGAYIDDRGILNILLVSGEDSGDKTLELQVLEWTGEGPVAFGSAQHSLAGLRSLQDKAAELAGELLVGCGVNQETNQLELDVTEVTDELLAQLAQLDPEEDLIMVRVSQRASALDGKGWEEPVSHDVLPGGDTEPQDPIAYEPQEKQPAQYDLLPLEE